MNWIEETDEQYHARSRSGEYMSSHMLSDFRKCPQLYWLKTNDLIEEIVRPAYQFGRAAHCLILEGRGTFENVFAVGGPINPTTGKPFGTATKKFEEWAAGVGKPVVSEDDYEELLKLEAAVFACQPAANLLQEGVAEVVCRAEYCGVPCQIRLDWYCGKGIVDLKTCDDLTWFEADARRYGYAHQLAFYRDVLAAHPEGRMVDVYMIAVEKKEPYRAGVWRLTEETLVQARGENEVALELFRACRDNDSWPTGYESVREF